MAGPKKEVFAMNNKTINILLSLLAVVLLVVYFAAIDLKFSGQRIEEKLDKAEEFVEQGRWEEAEQIGNEIRQSWKSMKFLFMINYAEADIMDLDEKINSFIIGIRTKNEFNTLTELRNIQNDLVNIKKVVPQP